MDFSLNSLTLKKGGGLPLPDPTRTRRNRSRRCRFVAFSPFPLPANDPISPVLSPQLTNPAPVPSHRPDTHQLPPRPNLKAKSRSITLFIRGLSPSLRSSVPSMGLTYPAFNSLDGLNYVDFFCAVIFSGGF